jgi:hypothetical protein
MTLQSRLVVDLDKLRRIDLRDIRQMAGCRPDYIGLHSRS